MQRVRVQCNWSGHQDTDSPPVPVFDTQYFSSHVHYPFPWVIGQMLLTVDWSISNGIQVHLNEYNQTFIKIRITYVEDLII